MATSLIMPGLVTIDGQPLTDEGRAPLELVFEFRGNTIELANGQKRQYIKSKIWTGFTVQYTNTAKHAGETIDGFAGRDEIKVIAFTPGIKDVVIEEKEGEFSNYSMLIDSYDESILQRRLNDSGSRYSLSFALTEAY